MNKALADMIADGTYAKLTSRLVGYSPAPKEPIRTHVLSQAKWEARGEGGPAIAGRLAPGRRMERTLGSDVNSLERSPAGLFEPQEQNLTQRAYDLLLDSLMKRRIPVGFGAPGTPARRECWKSPARRCARR